MVEGCTPICWAISFITEKVSEILKVCSWLKNVSHTLSHSSLELEQVPCAFTTKICKLAESEVD
jgi:hypothetical protein